VAGWIKETKLGIESSLIPLWFRWLGTGPICCCFPSVACRLRMAQGHHFLFGQLGHFNPLLERFGYIAQGSA